MRPSQKLDTIKKKRSNALRSNEPKPKHEEAEGTNLEHKKDPITLLQSVQTVSAGDFSISPVRELHIKAVEREAKLK